MRVRTIHKWIGIVIGLALLMWTVTGIIMAWPRERPREIRPLRLEFGRAHISPARALAQIAERDTAIRVMSLELIQVLDNVVYQVNTRRRTLLIDAETGQPFEITSAIAEQIARLAFPGTPGRIEVERLAKYDARYSSGDLPAYRVVMGDEAGTVSYVSARNGSIVSGDSRRRWRAVAGKLHDFSAIKVAISADWVHRALAIGISMIAVVSILTGYWLALPRGSRRPVRSTEPMSIR